MKTNNFFPQHSGKIKIEAMLRSLLCGLAVGFGANFVAALVTWLSPLNGFLLPLAALVAATVISAPIFYFAKFRPTAMSSARRLDSLGLDERLVTMVEYSNDDSLIANLQRNDAKAALAKTSPKSLKITISTAVIIALTVCVILGAGMTTINALGEKGYLPGGDELVDSFVEEQRAEYVTISYVIEEGGVFEGDEDQIIIKGTDATTITAIADDGYVFKGWDDGSVDPTRTDKAVMEDVVYVAIFTELGEGEEGDEGEESDEEQSNDAPSNNEDQNNQDNKPQDQPPQPNDNPMAGGNKFEPNNQVIDGNKFYGDELDAYYRDAALSLLEDENSGLSEAEKDLIKKYFGII